eukprot:3676658-Lingulodinium_polyedra.AAC.1
MPRHAVGCHGRVPRALHFVTAALRCAWHGCDLRSVLRPGCAVLRMAWMRCALRCAVRGRAASRRALCSEWRYCAARSVLRAA